MFERLGDILAADTTLVVVAWFVIGFGGVWFALTWWKKPVGAKAEAVDADRGEARNRDWHVVLDVAPDASMDDITTAYRQKIAQYHPDKVAHLGAEFQDIAAKRSQEINWAYSKAKYLRGG